MSNNPNYSDDSGEEDEYHHNQPLDRALTLPIFSSVDYSNPEPLPPITSDDQSLPSSTTASITDQSGSENNHNNLSSYKVSDDIKMSISPHVHAYARAFTQSPAHPPASHPSLHPIQSMSAITALINSHTINHHHTHDHRYGIRPPLMNAIAAAGMKSPPKTPTAALPSIPSPSVTAATTLPSPVQSPANLLEVPALSSNDINTTERTATILDRSPGSSPSIAEPHPAVSGPFDAPVMGRGLTAGPRQPHVTLVPVVVKPGSSLPDVPPPLDASTPVYKKDIPSFNRIAIDYTKNVNEAELSDVANQVRLALELRRRFLWKPARDTRHYDLRDAPRFTPPSREIPKKTNHAWKMIDGVAIAWEIPNNNNNTTATANNNNNSNNDNKGGDQKNNEEQDKKTKNEIETNAALDDDDLRSVSVLFDCPSRSDFIAALQFLEEFSSSGPMKSFTHNRLHVLEARFNLHELLNSDLETLSQKMVPHRDFYNVRKIDNHVHHSAMMNQKHLLRFIKHKLKKEGNSLVLVRNGQALTLSQVFESLNLSAYDLNVDMLDMHADKTFHRFDKFNLKYNPVGESRLREIFLKYNNLIRGRFLAEITQQVFDDLESNKYQFAEYRVSIYGNGTNEWDKLADWITEFNLFHFNVRWMIQVPRLYRVYKQNNQIKSFGDMLRNIFTALFEVTIDPSTHPSLHRFLQQCVAFDMVDDESVREKQFHDNIPPPDQWTGDHDPPYAMFAYYMYANLTVLNKLRSAKGFNTFAFRPHAGEAGDHSHLSATFLLAHGINHGLVLHKNPPLQYLYYLAQIGISMSPLSNNLLFVEYDKNPFPRFFKRGLNVTLSTDDPLMIHVTREPLVEEYSVAAQVWKLTAIDVCEIARNSVLQSGFEHSYKVHFLGNDYYKRGIEGNDIRQSNVPDVRIQYRYELLQAEYELLGKYVDGNLPIDQLIDSL